MKIKYVLLENFYEDVVNLSIGVNLLEFTPQSGGEENSEFSTGKNQNINIAKMLQSFSTFLEVPSSTGQFRKPYNTIRFEDFYENSAMVCYIALEDMTFSFMKYAGTQELKPNAQGTSVYDINFSTETLIDEYIKEDAWEVQETINIPKNSGILFNPDVFHKVECNLIQVFHLNRKIQNDNNDNNDNSSN